MHGGAKRSGGQPGNQNAFLHGYYSAAARAERKRLADQLRWIRAQMKEIADLQKKPGGQRRSDKPC
jgi:hypothetical protein